MIRWRLPLMSVLAIVLFFALVGPAPAARLIGRENVTISDPVKDDLYISGGQVEIPANVNGDVAVVGGNVRIKGDVSGDLFVGGGTVIVEGDIGHTARIVGGSVSFSGRIRRDLLAAGGNIILSNESAVGGDVLAAGGTFRALGSINGDVDGGFGNAEFNGPVRGNIDISVDRLTLSEAAKIKGGVKYRSSNKAAIDSSAKIGGKITRREPPQKKVEPAGRVLAWLWSLASMLVVGLVIAWLFPQSLKLTGAALTTQAWASLGVGFAALILTPIAVVMIMITVIGIPLALIALAFYALSIYLAQIYGAAALGSLVLNRGGEKWVGAGVAVGIAVFSVVRLIPILGGLAMFFLLLFGLGSMIIAGWRVSRQTGETL